MAASGPEELAGELAKGTLRSVYFLGGDEPALIDQALGQLRASALAPSTRTLNEEQFQGEALDCETLLASARVLPFLSPRRLLLVRNAHRLSREAVEGLIPYVGDPVPTACLVFCGDRPVPGTPAAGLLKLPGVRLVACERPRRPEEVSAWLRREAADRGITLAREAMEYLLEQGGTNLGFLAQELDKLAAFGAGSTAVSAELVRGLVASLGGVDPFALPDAVGGRQLGTALQELRAHLDAGAHPLPLLGTVARRIRLLWLARQLQDAGRRGEEMAGALRLSPFFARKLADQAKRYTEPELRGAFAELAEADLLLKSWGSDATAVLERLVMRLCGAPPGSRGH
ncbi:MAG: DNA polymerase III subunit delta [Deltaproteobacteria bacterium]|nr:DNA polymerase III subunit delta [Deltaproteobacteria bacterium]